MKLILRLPCVPRLARVLHLCLILFGELDPIRVLENLQDQASGGMPDDMTCEYSQFELLSWPIGLFKTHNEEARTR